MGIFDASILTKNKQGDLPQITAAVSDTYHYSPKLVSPEYQQANLGLLICHANWTRRTR